MEDPSLIIERGDQESHGDGNEKPAAEKSEEMASGLGKRLLHGLVSAEELRNDEDQEGGEHGGGRGGCRVAEEEAIKNGGDGEGEEVSGVGNGDSGNVGGKSGKIISNLMSNIFGQDEDDGKDEKEEEEEEAKEMKVNENGGAGVGDIINGLVSHLPASLPDNAAMTTDEATILIHSIIHD